MNDTMNQTAPTLRLQNIARTFYQGDRTLQVLRDASLEVRPGEIVALVGQSGSGKSTLLHIAGLLERPDSGEITLDGKACGKLDDTARTTLRRQYIGFVYQYHHLLAEFTALENVMLPQMLNGLPRGEARQRAQQLLQMLGLEERAEHRPAKLSGGEQQRVAIARAVANVPRLLLADEPTGNLDQKTADKVFAQLLALVLAARFRKPWPIVLGILVATLANHGLAGALGAWVTTVVGPQVLRWILGVSFIAMAVWMLIPDKLDEGDADGAPRWGVFGTTLVAFFLAEMGDKTQIATVMLAAQYNAYLWVVAGTTLGMMLANAPVVWLGDRITRLVPIRVVHGVSAVIFLVLGLVAIFAPV